MQDRGVYRLAAAVLLQAIQDATSSSMGRRAGAIRWISSNANGPYSFVFVCRALSRQPEEVRRYCQREIVKRRLPDLAFRPLMAPYLPEGPFVAAS